MLRIQVDLYVLAFDRIYGMIVKKPSSTFRMRIDGYYFITI